MIRRKLMSMKGDPRMISRGYALGILLGTTPFIGCKVFIALILTSLLKWSKLPAVFGVYHINLFTAPFFYGISYLLGRTILGTQSPFVFPRDAGIGEVFSIFYGNAHIFYSLLLGGIILGIPMAAAAYFFALAVTRKAMFLPGMAPVPATGPPIHQLPREKPDADRYTLITGASSGLGKEFAVECARRGMNLVLVALPGRNLELLCRVLEQQYRIRAVSFEVDLTDRDALVGLVSEILAGYRINFLVNNAGTGGTVAFDNSTPEYLERIIQLNIIAVSLMSRLLIPELQRHRQAWILNVSSMAAFSPIPYKTIYPASKAFVYNFSRCLNQELKGTGVSVSVIHPGPILTNPDVIVRIVRQGRAGKIGLLQAGEIARLGIDGVLAGKKVIIPGFMNKFNRFLMSAVPEGIRLGTLSRVIRREIAQGNPVAA
jgi:uncharacterized protein